MGTNNCYPFCFLGSNQIIYQKAFCDKQPNIIPQGLEGKTNSTQSYQKQGNNKDQGTNKRTKNWKVIENINKIKCEFFEKISETGKTLARLTKKREDSNK